MFYFGDDWRESADYAWFNENSGERTHPVGEKKPNAWGLHDMHGNVWEFCSDWYDEDYYAHSPTVDPRGPDTGAERVIRGGSACFPFLYGRSAFRDGNDPTNAYYHFGVRVCVGTD